MNFQINRNGNEADDIRDQFVELHQRLCAVRKHMDSMDYTHGRNYQTLENAAAAQEQDVRERFKMSQTLRTLENYAMEGAARAVMQREGL